MDRCAAFVDAGYLYAEGGKLCCGSAKRDRVQLSPSDARDFLAALAARASGVPVLRIYWYDGARDGIPTTEQQTIAALSNVKLRLGRLNVRRQQKGVDALIYRDLMTLARERAISDAYLIAGDEDLREGVRTAQDMGVRVTLIGIEPRKGTRNQSRELASEADEVVKLGRSDLEGFMSPREPATAQPSATPSPSEGVSEAARRHADAWLGRATDDEITALLAHRPRIPAPLDADLLNAAETAIGASLRGRDELRHSARRAFWDRVGASVKEHD